MDQHPPTISEALKQYLVYSVIDNETFQTNDESKPVQVPRSNQDDNNEQEENENSSKNLGLLLQKDKMYQISDIPYTQSFIEPIEPVEKQPKLITKSQQKLTKQFSTQTLPSTPIKPKQESTKYSQKQESAHYLLVTPCPTSTTKIEPKTQQSSSSHIKTVILQHESPTQLELPPGPVIHHFMSYNQHLFNFNKKAFVLYYKGSFIIDEILDPIENEHLLDYKEEKHVEFIFLLCVRAENYLKKALKLFEGTNNPNKIDLSSVEAYLGKIKAKFTVYNDMLDIIRGKIGQKISKLFKLEKSVSGKQVFLDGYEDLDYTTEQQIQFTYCKYIEIVLNSKEIKNKYFLNHRFKKILRGYRKLCELVLDESESEYQWRNKVNDIIIDQ